ncbi:MAG: beta-galactosidase [Sphingobacteriaceae bacterium]|jgi:beta-galactosidase/beta-glucuronidase|nr:beta-galactosidase [Sphingobacteriaceae bacterium]
MKRTSFIALLLAISAPLFSQTTSWALVEGKISTQWAKDVNPANPLPEYPRPQFVRENYWVNLNGLWDFSITPKSQQYSKADGKILVPFAVESSLSGVGKYVGKDSLLWYKRDFSIPSSMKRKKVLLHFGAVDWQTTVYVNGKEAGSHEGGYDPFSIDITPFLKKSGRQNLTVKVWDPSDLGTQPRGKQVSKPRGIWYTPVTGIWQTVWLEAVNPSYIQNVKITPDLDSKIVEIIPTVAGATNQVVRISAWDGSTKVAEQEIPTSGTAKLLINNPKHWEPGSPFLYDLKLELISKGRVVDQVKSYFAMRKISLGKDANGIERMLLNNKFVFQYGPLDQGWWPDGLYTAPTTAALLFDVDKTKEMGFNMIRKHIKVEPAIWYNYCDKVGMLVWQDMPSGDMENFTWEPRLGIIDKQSEKVRSAESEAVYRKEWNAIMDALHNVPSIVVWTPFNEAWGQFKTVDITNWTKQKDPSRLVNSASGGNFFPVGDMIDIHNYPQPAMPDPAYFGSDRALVLGEFGGLGLPISGHLWQEKNNWGYQTFKDQASLFAKYKDFAKRLEDYIKLGLSAAVYTQTTDVEIEINGLMTYDRKVIKVPEAEFRAVNSRLYNPGLVKLK